MTIGTHRITLDGQSKEILWAEEKDVLLQAERGIGFERIAEMLERGDYLKIVDHWNAIRYPNQRLFVLKIEGYAYYVPFVETPINVFLKTIVPSRKATKLYLKGH